MLRICLLIRLTVLSLLLPQIISSLVTVEGTLIFKGNNAANSEGGALYITTFGQIKLIQGARMIFTDNIGRCEVVKYLTNYTM